MDDLPPKNFHSATDSTHTTPCALLCVPEITHSRYISSRQWKVVETTVAISQKKRERSPFVKGKEEKMKTRTTKNLMENISTIRRRRKRIDCPDPIETLQSDEILFYFALIAMERVACTRSPLQKRAISRQHYTGLQVYCGGFQSKEEFQGRRS